MLIPGHTSYPCSHRDHVTALLLQEIGKGRGGYFFVRHSVCVYVKTEICCRRLESVRSECRPVLLPLFRSVTIHLLRLEEQSRGC
jgi:hypothetical protein